MALPPAVGGTTSGFAEPFFAFDPALKELEQNQRPDATAATVIAASATATAATRDAASLIVAPATVVSISTAAAATLGGLPLRAAVLARYPLPCRDMSLGSGGILGGQTCLVIVVFAVLMVVTVRIDGGGDGRSLLILAGRRLGSGGILGGQTCLAVVVFAALMVTVKIDGGGDGYSLAIVAGRRLGSGSIAVARLAWW